MTSSDPIAVFGATGAQGRPVVEQLLAAGRSVRAIAQTPEKLRALAHAGAEPHPLDLADQAALEGALKGVGGAFIHFPFVPVAELQRAWATAVGNALVANRVPIAVFSSSGPVPDEHTGVVTFDSKAAADSVLRASAARIVFLQPAMYLGNVSAPFSAPSVVADDTLRYPPLGSEVALPFISVDDQAAMAIAALARPDLIGRTLRIGQQLTGADLARGLSEGLGRAIAHEPMTPQQLGESVAPMMGAQVAQILSDDYERIAARPATLNLDADTEDSHRELGVGITPVAEWARTQDWPVMAAMGGA